MLRLGTIVWLLMVGCGGGQPGPTVTGAPLTAEEALLFDDGADFVADPEALEGQWRRDWSRELDQRVRRSDVIAYVTVQTVRTDTDLDRRQTYRLFVDERRTLLGTFPADLVLRTREGERGYGTVEGSEGRLLDQDFVLFLKWELPEGATEPVPRWHLSPGADDVKARVEYLIERRRDVQVRERGRIIVHEHRPE